MYRCPRCKYDQAKNLFGIGQFLDHRRLASGSGIDLDVPPETSLIKLDYERRLVKAGVLLPEDVTRPDPSTTDEQLVQRHVADIAERTPGMEHMADILRQAADNPTDPEDADPAAVTPWYRLTESQKQEHQQRVVDALDYALLDAFEILDLDAKQMSEVVQKAFIEISRLLLKHAMLAYDVVRKCGASAEEMASGQILAGFRPAADHVVASRNALRGTVQRPSVEDDPFLQLLTALSVPIQQAIDPHLRPEVFDGIMEATWHGRPDDDG